MVNELAFDDVRLARSARGDPAAADRLLKRVYPRVRQVVGAAVGDRQEAEELVQTCLLEIMEHLGGYRGTGSLESWAGQLSYRVSMRQLKRLRQRERTLIQVTEEVGVSPQNPEQELNRRRIWARLSDQLERIPRDRRITLVLRLVYGHGVAEVAEFTGVSINTTKDRLRTGFRELRAMFTKDPMLREIMPEAFDA